MFKWLSDRSLHIMMLAYFAAGSRGARVLELEDLLWAIVMEDQGQRPEFAGAILGAGPIRVYFGWRGRFKMRRRAHLGPESPFISPAVARDVLGNLRTSREPSGQTRSAGELRASDGVNKALARASRVTQGLRRKRIQPLHLLEAIAADEGSEAGMVLRNSGITRDAILNALRGDRDES